MDINSPLPCFIEAGRLVQSSTVLHTPINSAHFDMLAFLSIAEKLQIEYVQITWQPSLESLGAGATSTVQQAKVDAEFNLAFKRSVPFFSTDLFGTDQQQLARYKALICELIALASLTVHPNVIDLLGYTLEVEADTELVWPVLLTERSVHGNLKEFFSSGPGRDITCQEKLRLCCDVAEACRSMHAIGIVHGDIKEENILIFSNGQGWMAKLIDFGYSCLGSSDDEMVKVPRSRPWQAPEHKDEKPFKLSAARRMDLYSFGMLMCIVLIPESLPGRISKDRGRQNINRDFSLMDLIERQKMSNEFLREVLKDLESSISIDKISKKTIHSCLELLLQNDPELRAGGFDTILEILRSKGSRYEAAELKLEPLDSLFHSLIDIGSILADFEDADYLLHNNIVADLKNRVSGPCCDCTESSFLQLWLCYEIGFGVKRDTDLALQWLQKTSHKKENTMKTIARIDEIYEARSPTKLCERLGYDTNLPYDPVALYIAHGRLKDAAEAFTVEMEGRMQSMGRLSKSYISQLSNLALILTAQGKFAEAENVSYEAVLSSGSTFGTNSSETISAENYYAYTLFHRGKWAELEKLQQDLIPRKETSIGPDDATTLNSQNYLIVAYYFQENYDQCIELAEKLTYRRTERLGIDHPETLVTENWLCRALLENGNLRGLEDKARKLVQLSEKACGILDDATTERKEILAAVLLALSKPHLADANETLLEETLHLVLEVLDKCDVPQANIVLCMRAQITLICVLALQGCLDHAQTELEAAQAFTVQLKERLGADYIELKRLAAVERYIATLKEDEIDGRLGGRERDLTRECIARRWKLRPNSDAA